MTVREYIYRYLHSRGMFPGQAQTVLAAVVAQNPDVHWDDPATAYPNVLLAALSVSVDSEALTFIDAHCPQAWFRPMFAGPTPMAAEHC